MAQDRSWVAVADRAGLGQQRVEELYGKLTNHGYGGGLVDVVARQGVESGPSQRAAPPERPDAEP